MDDCDGALERDIAYILSASPFDKRLGYVIPILAQSSRERFYKYYERIACYLGSLRNSRNSFLNSFQGHNDERTARAWGLLHTSVKFLLQANRRLVCVCVPGNYPPQVSMGEIPQHSTQNIFKSKCEQEVASLIRRLQKNRRTLFFFRQKRESVSFFFLFFFFSTATLLAA